MLLVDGPSPRSASFRWQFDNPQPYNDFLQLLNPPILELLGHQLPSVEQQETAATSSASSASAAQKTRSSVAHEGIMLSSARTLLAFANRRRYDKYPMSFKLPGAGGGLDWVPVMYHLHVEYLPTMKPYAVNVAVQVGLTPVYRSLSSFSAEQPFPGVRSEVGMQLAGMHDELLPHSAPRGRAAQVALGLGCYSSSHNKQEGMRDQAMHVLLQFDLPTPSASGAAKQALRAQEASQRVAKLSLSRAHSTQFSRVDVSSDWNTPIAANSPPCTPSYLSSPGQVQQLEEEEEVDGQSDEDEQLDSLPARSTFSSSCSDIEQEPAAVTVHSSGTACDNASASALQRTSSSAHQSSGGGGTFAVLPPGSISVTLSSFFPTAQGNFHPPAQAPWAGPATTQPCAFDKHPGSLQGSTARSPCVSMPSGLPPATSFDSDHFD